MRQRRIAILVSLLTAGVLGGYWVATGQEGRTPWPPPPVKFDATSAGEPSVPPPVPPSGTMPPAPPEKKDSPVRKWATKTPSGSSSDTLKLRACGVGEVSGGIQQVGYQERAADVPPPVPAKPTIGAAMPSVGDAEPKPLVPPVPVMPDAPGGAGVVLPILPPPVAIQPQSPTPPAMPVVDPPKPDPTRSVITDPVQQQPSAARDTKPPAFVLVRPRKDRPATPQAPTPSAPPMAPTIAPVVPIVDPLPPPVAPAHSTQQAVARTLSPPDASRLLDVQTPSVMVEKRSVASARPGEPRAFQLVVRNLGAVAASQITVEDELPADARITQADPMPQVHGSRAVWLLTDLAPGAVRVLSLSLQGGSADSAHNTRVHVSAASRPGTPLDPVRPVQPAMPAPSVAVQVVAPPTAMTGRPAVFEVTFANTGKVRVTGLLLHALLSNGLRHPVGQNIEAEVGDLGPGVSKTVKVTVTAVLPGRQGIQVHVKGPNGAEAAAQAAVEVTAPPAGGLGVQQPPATRLFAGRMADLRIEITNYTAQPMRQINVVSYLPDGIDLIAASDSGNYQPSGRTVNWLIDTLAPGQTQALLLRVNATTPGQLTHTVLARAVGVPEIKSTSSLSVEGVADLLVDLHADNALELGNETVYEVRVTNPGSGPCTTVRVALEFTPGLVPRNAQGPTAFHIEGQRVIFDALSPLASQGQTLYRVLVVGQSVGDARARASVVSDQVTTPVMREAATRVYRD